MTTEALLELSHVGYDVAGKRILEDINWRIDRHQHWVLLGRNGAGKTTLLKIACGYLWPNAGGDVLRSGKRLADLRELRCSIGWVTSTLAAQIPRVEPALDTVVSGRFAGIGLRRLGIRHPSANDYRDARCFLERFGIPDLAQRPFGVLSQGEQQKTLLARACMARPMLTILDEPCAGLDPASRESFLHAVQELAMSESAPSLVLVTHHVEEIMPAFAHMMVLENGRCLGSGLTKELLDHSLLERLYDGAISKLVWNRGRCWPIGR